MLNNIRRQTSSEKHEHQNQIRVQRRLQCAQQNSFLWAHVCNMATNNIHQYSIRSANVYHMGLSECVAKHNARRVCACCVCYMFVRLGPIQPKHFHFDSLRLNYARVFSSQISSIHLRHLCYVLYDDRLAGHTYYVTIYGQLRLI